MPASRAPAEAPGLGYKGLLYSDVTSRARAHRACVTTQARCSLIRHFSTARFLLEQIPPEYAALGKRIASELAGWK